MCFCLEKSVTTHQLEEQTDRNPGANRLQERAALNIALPDVLDTRYKFTNIVS